MPNYENGKIYKIINDVIGMTYYGSTTQPLSKRMVGHRHNYKRKYHKTYELWGDIKDCKIYLIELCPCDLKIELLQRERYYIENNDCINKEIPSRSSKEYYEDNKEQILLKRKEYRENNKEKIAEYYEDNKDKLILKVKEYRETNKEKISLKKKEQYKQKKLSIVL